MNRAYVYNNQTSIDTAGISLFLSVSLLSFIFHGPANESFFYIFNVVTQKAFAVLGVCTCIFVAGGSVSVYLQHCEPNSGCKNR